MTVWSHAVLHSRSYLGVIGQETCIRMIRVSFSFACNTHRNKITTDVTLKIGNIHIAPISRSLVLVAANRGFSFFSPRVKRTVRDVRFSQKL